MRSYNDLYHPYKHGFPYKLLKYLYQNGVSAGIDIQEDIGLNKWAKAKGDIYANRATSNFDGIVYQLEQRGLIKIIQGDYYELTPDGKEFIENYRIR